MTTVASEWRLAHKAGQLRSLQRVLLILCAILFATILFTAMQDAPQNLESPPQDSIRMAVCIERLSGLPARSRNSSSASDGFAGSPFFIKCRIVDKTSLPTVALPNASIVQLPIGPSSAPPVYDLSLDVLAVADDQLPQPRINNPVYNTPLLAAVAADTSLRHPARLFIADVQWPEHITLGIDEVPVVSGLITLHADGDVSFVMHEQTHPGLSFDIAVHRAIQKATCDPALNYRGVPITVVAPYCVEFKRTGATINSTSSIQSVIQNDFH